VKSLTATEASRRFSEVLDQVESGEETFLVVRRGRSVARIVPVSHGLGRAVKDVLREGPADEAWASDLAEVRELLSVEDRRWSG